MKKKSLSLAFLPVVSLIANNPTKPNVIIIYADDIGYGDLSCYGYSKISTPNVDKLAESGIRFTNAHCVAASSTPSRYSLFTGEYAWRQKGTGVLTGDAAMIIQPDRPTLPKLFKQNGYTTGAVGKWHLGLGAIKAKQNWNGLITPGLTELGFDFSYIMAATGDRTPCVFIENGRVVNLDRNDPISVSYIKNFEGEPTGKDNPELLKVLPSGNGHNKSIINGISRIGYMKGGKSALWVDENIADSITAKALNFINSNKNHPFFLYFGTQDAHVPRVPHPRFVGKSGLGPRGDAILEFDWSVGQIMAKLKELQLEENTLILLSSDNGPVIDDGYQDKAAELLGEHKPWGPFRGGKYSAFEAGTRVPQLISWKSKIKPKVSNALTSHVDWYASLANLISAPLSNGECPDSQNQLQVLMGKDKKGRTYAIKQNANIILSIIKEDWKYIEPNNPDVKVTNIELGNSKIPQLYNLKTDMGEKQNLNEMFPEKALELKTLLELEKTKFDNPNGTSINQTSMDNSFELYPSPAKDKLYFRTEIESNHLEIIDVYGKRIQIIPNASGSIDISGFSPGVYCLCVTNKGKKLIRKFLKY